MALGMPAPVEASRATYGTDVRLAAFFASPDRMAEVFGADRALIEFLASPAGTGTEPILAVLLVERTEKKVLGMVQQDGRVMQEVAQVQVSFDKHRLVDPWRGGGRPAPVARAPRLRPAPHDGACAHRRGRRGARVAGGEPVGAAREAAGTQERALGLLGRRRGAAGAGRARGETRRHREAARRRRARGPRRSRATSRSSSRPCRSRRSSCASSR